MAGTRAWRRAHHRRDLPAHLLQTSVESLLHAHGLDAFSGRWEEYMYSQAHFHHANNAPYLWYNWHLRHPANPPLDADLDHPLWKQVVCILHRVKANVPPTTVGEGRRARVVYHHMYDGQFGM